MTRELTRVLVRDTVIDIRYFSNSKNMIIFRFSDGINMRNGGKSILYYILSKIHIRWIQKENESLQCSQ